MRQIIPLIIALLLTVACTEQRQDIPVAGQADSTPVVTVQLAASTSTAVVASRALENTSTWDPKNVVLLEFRDDTLRWCRTIADPRLDINAGNITITDNETDRAVELVMLANVDTTKITTAMRTSGKAKDEIIKEINTTWNYDVLTATGSMPLAGDLTLPNLREDTSTGVIPLRRVMAQVSVQLQNTSDQGFTFDLEEMIVVNVPGLATLYNPDTDKPRLPGTDGVNSQLFDWSNNPLKATVDANSNSATVLIPEASNSDEKGKQISVLFKAKRKWTKTNQSDSTYYYRLDLCMEQANDTIAMDVLRNRHYNFFLLNLAFSGVNSYNDCMQLTTAHNMRKQYMYPGSMVFILDEDIMSITANILDENSKGRLPNFIGVSSSSIELSKSLGVTRVTILTNIEDFGVYEIPGYESILDFQYGDSTPTEFKVYSESNSVDAYEYTAYTETIWVWLDNPDAVSVGDTFLFYVYGGNIQKPITLTITE